MRIVITGAGGFLGRAIVPYLRSIGWECFPLARLPGSRPVTYEPMPDCDAVLHLGGESVVGLWTPAKRRAIVQSRVESTAALVARIHAFATPPRVFLCASAVGWYGHRPGEILIEESAPDPQRAFRWQVCTAWEQAAAAAEKINCRVVNLRFANVLDRSGGFLGGLLPVYSRLGCWTLGNPQSAISWVSLEDCVRMVGFALETDTIRGPLNIATPYAVTQRNLSSGLAQALGKSIRGRIPSALLRGTLGEFSHALLDDQRVRPARAEALGFRFSFPAWRGWLQESFMPSLLR